MIELIQSRRSIRSYSDKKVRDKDLDQIVQCGVMAPSGMNTQGIEFCVITNELVLKELEDLAGRPFFYQAPALIVVYGEKDNRYAAYDGSCAMTQMQLAACALNLGSCWINQMKDYVLEEKFDAVMTRLGLKDKVIVGSLAVGYGMEGPKEKQIKENRIHYVK